MREPDFPYLEAAPLHREELETSPESLAAEAPAPEVAAEKEIEAVEGNAVLPEITHEAEPPEIEDIDSEEIDDSQLKLELELPVYRAIETLGTSAKWEENYFVDTPDIGDVAASMPTPHEFLQAIEAEGVKHRPLDFAQRLALLFAPIAGTIYDMQMRRRGVRLVRQRLQLAGIPRQTPSLKVGFITDLHYGPLSGVVAARQAWSQLHDAKPDVVLMGGDFLYADHRGLPTLLREIQRWKWDWPRGGMYAVLGNHDYNSDTVAIVMALQACGVQVLCNESVALPEPWNSVWIAGIDDTRHGKPDIKKTLKDVPQGACTIMVSHSPDVCAYQELKQCRLTLCGDTHGGQICMPNGDPIHVPGEWGKNFPAGMYRHAGNWVFVSRGVGVVGLPVRMFAPPDVAIFDIAGTGGGNSH